MNDTLITSDHPLNEAQRKTLAALLDTLVPPNEEKALPGAGDVDLVAWLQAREDDFLAALSDLLTTFEDSFAALDYADRHQQVQRFSEAQPELFGALLFNVYGCYYEDERVKQAIGMGAGAPFPRGNTVEAGDLSLLDPVIEGSHAYRK